jgi:iron(III) transport system permease protein
MKAKYLPLVIVALVLFYGVIYPCIKLFIATLFIDGSWSVKNYTELLFEKAVLEAIWSTVTLSMATVAGSALVGVPLALLFDRYEFPGRRFFAALVTTPIVLPPLVGTLAFYYLCGDSGILARLIQNVFGLQDPPWQFGGWGAVLLFHVYTIYPFFYVLTRAGLQRIDADLPDAARSLGAGKYYVLGRVLLPQLTPSLIAAALMAFMTSMASFSAPFWFGKNLRVLTTEIVSARQRNDTSGALTLTFVLAIISLGALVLFQRYEGTRRFAASAMKGATRTRTAIPSGPGRAVAVSSIALFSIILMLPIATLVILSFARPGSWTTQILPPAYTIDNYVQIISEGQTSRSLINSGLMSGIAALAALFWSFCVTAVVLGPRTRWRRLVSFLVLIPWALPGTVVALAIAETYGQPNPLTADIILVGTFWILPVIYFLRFMPLVVRAVQASMEQLDRGLEEAAGSLGAGWFRRISRIRLPLIFPGVMAGTLLAFIIGLGEYVASVLVFVPGNEPISIAIAREWRDLNLGRATAYGVILIAAVGVSLVIGGRFGQKSERLGD